MIGSFHVIYGSYLRDRITRYGDATHYNEMNVLSMHALIGAYKPEGSEWLHELRTVLEENARYYYDEQGGCAVDPGDGTEAEKAS